MPGMQAGAPMKQPKQEKLVKPTRSCTVCGCEGSCGSKVMGEKEPVILAVNMTVYRRTRRGRQLATSKRVRVCERCVIRAAASQGPTEEGAILGTALIARLWERYSAMVATDKKLSRAEKGLGLA